MALKNTHPLERSLRAKFNLLTRSGSSLLRSLPFGGAVGVVVAGAVLWFAPRLVPAGWGAEAVLSLGMGGGIVLHRLIDALLGWFFDPVERHLRARWEAAIRLAKLARYRKQGLIAEAEAQSLQRRIVQDDVSPKKRR